MALERTTVEQSLVGCKFYLDDLQSKNIKGKHYEEVEQLYNHALELGEQSIDQNDFNAKINSEQIQQKMADAYTKAITGNIGKKTAVSAGVNMAVGIAGRAAMSAGGTLGSTASSVRTGSSFFGKIKSLFNILGR